MVLVRIFSSAASTSSLTRCDAQLSSLSSVKSTNGRGPISLCAASICDAVMLARNCASPHFDRHDPLNAVVPEHQPTVAPVLAQDRQLHPTQPRPTRRHRGPAGPRSCVERTAGAASAVGCPPGASPARFDRVDHGPVARTRVHLGCDGYGLTLDLVARDITTGRPTGRGGPPVRSCGGSGVGSGRRSAESVDGGAPEAFDGEPSADGELEDGDRQAEYEGRT